MPAEYRDSMETPDASQSDSGAAPARRRDGRSWRWRLGLIAILVVAAGAFAVLSYRRSDSTPASKPGPAERVVPVVAVAARAANVAVYLSGIGAVTPVNTVTVRSRVDGQLMSVRFAEGQLVKAGDLLAEIDPRPFQAQLTQFQGQLERDQALLDNARVDVERYRVLYQQDSIPQQQLATQESLVHQYEGAVKNDQGLIDSTRVQLDYCRITSPIAGRVGLRLVDAGNIVHAADIGGLVVITQLEPIGVVFTVPEDSVPAVLDKLAHGASLAVEAYDREQRHQLAAGSLVTIDNQVDPATGTVKLKAAFPNADHKLFPNQFVNARLLLDTKRGATVVPSAAVQRSSRGALVFVVRADQTAVSREVTVGVTSGDDVAIDKGVAPGERVVVDGADRLRDGSRIVLEPRRG